MFSQAGYADLRRLARALTGRIEECLKGLGVAKEFVASHRVV